MLNDADDALNFLRYGMLMPKLTSLTCEPRDALIDAPLPVPFTFASEYEMLPESP